MADLDAAYRVHRLWQAADRDALLAAVADSVTGVVTRSVIGADAALMTALPKLEVVAVFGVGTDAVDLAAARRQGVRVANTPGVLTEDTADYGMALLLALARRIVEGDRHVRQGRWPRGLLPNSTRVNGKKLGVVGLGRIGAGVARRAEAFAMQVFYTGPKAKSDVPWTYVDTTQALAREVDFLVLTCPGGPATAGLVDERVLEALGPHGMLVNIARASVVDEQALVSALKKGKIKAAALDVFPDEPNVSSDFLAMENVILEPHIASTTVETRMAICDMVLENLAAHYAGRVPPGIVG
ncbi:2-hydroxyacid dehydrogenase [Mesorhizobium sp. 8]|uniref:2-hydroxyacid dehydrogenase n=1 Tax=Mesorhizobium sp. 8 TaxID=2584466 RepID=UPI001FEE6D89|nr:2-hydroxyacid dehydrogenase [Mesorhizobium sp. 8]